MLYQYIAVSVPGAPKLSFGAWEHGIGWNGPIENKRVFQFRRALALIGEFSKTAVFCGFPVPALPIERGVSSGPPLSLQLGGRKDSNHADDEFSNRSRSLYPPASPSGTTSTVGRRCSLAGIAAPWRKSASGNCAGSSRARLLRTYCAEALDRGRSVASRSWSWGAAANRPASPRTPTFSGGYSHD